ncbi:uncharacterized protein SAPINGB_P003137 [Magnusiomyces paraingens]|uniref:GPI transamidase component GAB1 n=1 Tax=Magnusiomyces paraingens TaxID=2606893 RepID=A0A5E8BJX7_9ASCO|nr:uncharacterized protein SAPINGB_P003137 [Saprochaete ingens]VVT51561.1 unnamed protein product [Saprochaete ingens]
MPFDTSAIAVFGIATVFRTAIPLLVPSLQPVLDGRVEITTPVSSFKRLQEGLFLYSSSSISATGSSIYESGVCHHSPLLVAFFSLIKEHGLPLHLPFTIADIVGALCLYAIASTLQARSQKQAAETSKEKSEQLPPPSAFSPAAVAAVYLFNPFSLLASFAHSTNVLTNTLVLAAIASGLVVRRPLIAMLFLALASVLSIYPLCFLPALAAVSLEPLAVRNVPTPISNGSRLASIKAWALLITFFLAYAGLFLYMSYVVAGYSWSFVESTYYTVLMLKDLTPNMGLWWYFFVEMFTFFRPFFLCVFQLFATSFAIPITIRFYTYPLFALTIVSGTLALLKPYPEVTDLGFYLSLLTLFKPVFVLLRFRQAVALAFLYSSALAPTFYHLWIYLGSGNSNFFYAITLVYALGLSLSLTDTIWVGIRLLYDGGKNPRVTQI